MATANKKSPLIGLLTMKVREDADSIIASGRCVTKFQGSRELLDTEQLTLDVAVMPCAGSIKFGSRYGRKIAKGFSLNTYEIRIKKRDALTFDIQNKLILNYKGEYQGRILYRFLDYKTGKNRNSKVFVNDGIAMYFRQSKFNSLGLTVRDANQYDYPEGQARLKKAAQNAKKLADRDIVLMYEKNCMRFEESASVLYKKLIDQGYDNVYFVVNLDNPAIQDLAEKYKKNLIEKDSDQHLEYFFASNKWVSSESTEHALQLRIASKLAMDKIKSKDLQYVFLQHGVMYMVSLNSELRTGFRNSGYKLQRTVVSSQAEAHHFIDLADMKSEDLYVTGLAKFDECYRNADADRIVIMPTWRRWETNLARTNLEETKYYQMIERMYNAVPDNLKDKVDILPHPLMAERFKGDSGLADKIRIGVIYDEILKNCEMLITDYSSIAYDSFYRGANVVFCWEEKDECMEHYGEGSYLMLNEDNVFGPVCMTEKDVNKAVTELYGQPQSQDNLNKYRKIVEFHDGKNSERIIECLKKDGMIT